MVIALNNDVIVKDDFIPRLQGISGKIKMFSRWAQGCFLGIG